MMGVRFPLPAIKKYLNEQQSYRIMNVTNKDKIKFVLPLLGILQMLTGIELSFRIVKIRLLKCKVL
jgi:hypothetical protein